MCSDEGKKASVKQDEIVIYWERKLPCCSDNHTPRESENIRFGKTVWEATKVVAVFSFMIEFTQLLFHLGTFQISDLTYNTLGGAVGGMIYYNIWKVRHRRVEEIKK